jgi:hypothetical protein
LAEPNQYLRLVLGGVNYLLPSTASFSIEQREGMVVNDDPAAKIAAWRIVKSKRWPAYSLDGEFRVIRHDDWQRAVFLDAVPNAIGLVVDEVQLLPRVEVRAVPFTPLGAPPLQAGHLFSSASIVDKNVILVINPKTLIVYLQALGE